MLDLWSFLLQTLTVSGVAVLLLSVKGMLRDKLPPRWQFGIWGVLALSILMPAGWGGRYVLVNWGTVVELLKGLAQDYSITRVILPFPVLIGLPESGIEWLFLLYVLGAAVSIFRYGVSYWSLRRVIRQRAMPSEALSDQIRQVSEQYGLPCPRVLVVPGLPSAFVCGFFRPVLVVPGSQVDDKVILHELIHLKNRDTVLSLVICLLRALHWCNPLVVYCSRQALNDLEARCDQMVLELLEGEDRRDYGRILLSMVNDRYAGIPGATCVNNGGKAIRQRIEAITRFRLYPAGMKLVSRCAVVILAITVIIGAPATAISQGGSRLELASARTVYCTTPAGAFDCYAKAVLNRNATGRVMSAPEADQEALAKSFPYWDSGIPVWPEVNSGYYIYNLSCTDDVYEGLLVVELSGNPDGTPIEENTCYIAYQPLRVQQENGRWVTYAEGDFQTLSTPKTLAIVNWECWALPSLRYVGETDGFRFEVQHQTVHSVENFTYESGFFGSTQLFDRIPKPHARFDRVAVSHNGTVTHLGTQEQRDEMSHLGIGFDRIMPGEERPDKTGIYNHQSSSSSSSDGSGWSNRSLEPGWGPVLNLYGGGSMHDPENKPETAPECYFVELYINHKYVTTLELKPEEGGAK